MPENLHQMLGTKEGWLEKGVGEKKNVRPQSRQIKTSAYSRVEQLDPFMSQFPALPFPPCMFLRIDAKYRHQSNKTNQCLLKIWFITFICSNF